jgi:hypothetical protein
VSLALANALDKRLSEPEPQVKLRPYRYPSKYAPCPLCGVQGTDAKPKWGPSMPAACTEGAKCPGFPKPHFHQSCGYCQGYWLMATKT